MKMRKCITWFTKKRKTHLLEHCHWNKIIKKSQKSYRRGSLHWLGTYEKCKYSPYRLERNVGGQKICGNNNTNSSALSTSHNMIQALLKVLISPLQVLILTKFTSSLRELTLSSVLAHIVCPLTIWKLMKTETV